MLSETERADLAAEMRRWTQERVEKVAMDGISYKNYDAGDSRRIALAELLRREREAMRDQCADVCRDWAADMRATYDFVTNRWAHREAAGAEECEHRIRGLS